MGPRYNQLTLDLEHIPDKKRIHLTHDLTSNKFNSCNLSGEPKTVQVN